MAQSTKPDIEPVAIELWARSPITLAKLAADLARRFGADAPTARTLARWRAGDSQEAWLAAEDQRPGVDDASSLSVDAELDLLRACRRRRIQLLRKQGDLSANELGILRNMRDEEAVIEKRIDPDGMLHWLEQFLRWTADGPEDEYAVVAKHSKHFAEHVFGLIDAAALEVQS